MQPNIENINKAIAVMERVHLKYGDKFAMFTFQHSHRLAFTEQEFVECGTSCCFSGWLNIAPEFADYPEKKLYTTAFEIGNIGEVQSLAELFNISNELSYDIIYYDLNNTAVWGNYNIGSDSKKIKPTHIIDILLRIRDGELK
jgi:hypothetical protein